MGSAADEGLRALGPAEAGGVLTIDLGAILANWRTLGKHAAPAECAAVIKADAYGCGIGPVADALAKAGCETFFVAHVAEARAARKVAAGATIYVLNGLMPGTAAAYAEADLRPVLGSTTEFDEWTAFRAATSWLGGAAVHVDTGMNRLGLGIEEAAALAQRLSRSHGISLLMSHFAVSDQAGHPLNAKQIGLFGEMRALFPGIAGSLANSSGIFLSPDAHHDMVRPGVALFGANPTPQHFNRMQPVVSLAGRIIQVRTLPAGDTVGYGATWTAARDSRLAIVSIGYADGFLRAAGSTSRRPGADAIIAGRRCALAGRISMDLLAVDVTDLPAHEPQRGDFATLLGEEIGVDDLAVHAGTIGYEVLTSLGRRYHRVYRD